MNFKKLESVMRGFNYIRSFSFNELEENKMFEAINLITDFITENEKNLKCDEYEVILNSLVDIIEFSNNNNYSLSEFKTKYSNIMYILENLESKFISGVKINIYFYGRDKYNIIPNRLRDGVIFKGFYNSELQIEDLDLNEINILLLSEETFVNLISINKFDKVIYYDEFFNRLFSKFEVSYYNNYDYNFLSNNIEKAKNEDVNSTVVGLSYSLHGINEKKLNKETINLSLPSQDIYYSFKIAQEIIDFNSNIKNLIIGLSYYSLHFDLSMSKGSEIQRVENVYYPIFNDSHNHYFNKEKMLVEIIKNDDIDKLIFDFDQIQIYFMKLLNNQNKSYFNEIFTRDKCSMLGAANLFDIEEQQKYKLGEERANQHNKSLKYTNTLKENKITIEMFIKYLYDRGINSTIVIFPTTKYYSKYLDKEFKCEFYKVIDLLKQKYLFNILDLFDSDLFDEKDFIDLDHLNQAGADKVSKIISDKGNIIN